MIKIIICGALGRMGRAVAEEISGDPELELAGAVEAETHRGLGTLLCGIEITSDLRSLLASGDVLVDFTNPAAALYHTKESASAGKAAVVGTTGMTEAQMAGVREAAGSIPVLVSPNMSAGVNLMCSMVEEIARALPDFDVEIMEMHHSLKKDSPSGTARRLADFVEKVRTTSRRRHGREGMTGPRPPEELGIHSLRGGDVVGEHTVIFAGAGERLEITHRAHSRRTFARGTLRAVRFVYGREPGLYSMEDVLGPA